jgi:hypothetical protein
METNQTMKLLKERVDVLEAKVSPDTELAPKSIISFETSDATSSPDGIDKPSQNASEKAERKKRRPSAKTKTATGTSKSKRKPKHTPDHEPNLDPAHLRRVKKLVTVNTFFTTMALFVFEAQQDVVKKRFTKQAKYRRPIPREKELARHG